MQLLLAIAWQRIRVIQVGRGGGKSFIVALEIKELVYDMPQSKNFILGETYQQILTRTLPSTIKALALLGFHKDLHYFIGRYPPKSWKWKEAWEPPLDPKHSIFFFNGTVFDLLSQDTNSRGGNYSAGIIDEAQDIDNAKLESQVIPTMRGEFTRFKKHKTYRRLTLLCSMPRTRKAGWIFNYRELAIKFPKIYLWISGPSRINADNLPPDWFTDQKRILTKSEYDIEIENIEPKKIQSGFYIFFDDTTCSYTAYDNNYLFGLIDKADGYNPDVFNEMNCLQDADFRPDNPLEIAMDYGGWFNCIVTGQETADGNFFDFLSAMWIDDKGKFDDLIIQWCTYYRFHRNKTVYYYYDQTAKGKDSRVEEYYITVCRIMRGRGWTVIQMDIGLQPTHNDRYEFWKRAHAGTDPDLPGFRYNRHNAKWLIVSLNNAAAKQVGGGMEKIKVDEKNHDIDQKTTTHFSDAHDTLAVAKYGARTLKGTSSIGRARLGN
ncbi:hypothetical protein [Pedobacter antarcticus]|uniref:hypothetical protein n=1 Tax=Pedobacter antarcticus TaxID=34086 RepID=UPI00115FAFF2|nr:hypothetical protein [Pedobacter antarcticus]